MLNSSSISSATVARVVVAIGFAAAFVLLRPSFSPPFEGCKVPAYLTLDPSCTMWFDVLEGFGIVVLVGLLGPRSLNPHKWGLAIAIALAAVGGVDAMKQGYHLSAWANPSSLPAYWLDAGYSLASGALVGFFAMRFFLSRRSDDRV